MKLDPNEVNINDLDCIISAAKAVAISATEALPWRDSYQWAQINHLGDMLSAVTWLLNLAEAYTTALQQSDERKAA